MLVVGPLALQKGRTRYSIKTVYRKDYVFQCFVLFCACSCVYTSKKLCYLFL